MRIFFLGNNWVGWQVLKWFKEQNEQIVGVAIHPSGKRKCGDKIIDCAQVSPEHIFDGAQIHQPKVLETIKELHPDIGVSVLFDYILRPELLDLFSAGVVNLHPAYLPYNRGQYPNVWSIVEGTPAGVTLHYIDNGIDTGSIIAQREVPVKPVDTGGTLYHKLERESVNLFKRVWPLIRSGQVPLISQSKEDGTYHRTRDVEQIDHIDLDRTYKARDLIDIIRARTFPPYPGAYFKEQGRKVYLRLQLLYGEELEGGKG